MEQKSKSLKELKQRKFLLVLPILVLPFITLLFWLGGGGKIDAADFSETKQKGLNIKLPNANLKEVTVLDKMSHYELAALDSAKVAELIKKDPNYLTPYLETDSTVNNSETLNRKADYSLNTSVYEGGHEQKIHQKLEALQKALNTPATSALSDSASLRSKKSIDNNMESAEIVKLEQMMQSMNNSDTGSDPELQQLSGMLENILDIQHPDRVQEKLRKSSEVQRGKVFTIDREIKEDNISSFQNSNAFIATPNSNGFYSLDDKFPTNLVQNAVEAVIHESQTIVNGSIVKLRLNREILINGVRIPENNFVFGTASLKGERLNIKINSIRYNNSLFPVDLSVYDMDGLIGIYIPGAISRDSAKESADRSMQTLGMTSLNDSWGAQAAGVGIEAAKSLLSKKVKLIKVEVKSGYQVLLFDDKQKTN